MKYLLLLNRTDDAVPALGTPEAATASAEFGAWNDDMKAAGVFVDCEPLHGRSASTTVRVRDGEALITDGPSAEIKEQLGGYAVVECDDLDEALRWAVRSPAARDASVEVRPIAAKKAPM